MARDLFEEAGLTGGRDLFAESGIAPPAVKKRSIGDIAGDIGTALFEGTKATGRTAAAGGNTLTGDLADVERYATAQKAAAANAPAAKTALMQDIERRKAANKNPTLFSSIADVAGAAAENPEGTAQFVVEQAPNSAVVLGTGLAGMKAGAAGGAALGSVVPVVGTAVGGIAGGIIGGLGGLFLGNSLLETGGKAIEKAEGGFTSGERKEALREGAVKGAVISGIDAATLGAGSLVAKSLGRAAIKAGAEAEARVLADAGVNLASRESIEFALASNPVLKKAAQEAGQKAASAASTLKNRAVTAGTVGGMETVGEGAGEYFGELAATGEGNYHDAALEALAGLSQSAPEAAFAMRQANGNRLSIDGIAGANVQQPPPAQEPPPSEEPPISGLLTAPAATGTPSDQIITADVARANEVAAAQANADAIYGAREAFEAEQAKAQLGSGAIGRAAAAGIDSGAIAPDQVTGIDAGIQEPGAALVQKTNAQRDRKAAERNQPVQGVANGATGSGTAQVAQAGGQGASNQPAQGVPAAVEPAAGGGLDATTGGTAPGSAADLAAGTAAGGAGVAAQPTGEPTKDAAKPEQVAQEAGQAPSTQSQAQTEQQPAKPVAESQAKAAPGKDSGLSVGTTPKNAEPITVRNGVVYQGDYEALNAETGEPITVPEGADNAAIAQALRDGKVLSSKQKIYGLGDSKQDQPADLNQQAEPEAAPDKETKADGGEKKAAKTKAGGEPNAHGVIPDDKPAVEEKPAEKPAAEAAKADTTGFKIGDYVRATKDNKTFKDKTYRVDFVKGTFENPTLVLADAETGERVFGNLSFNAGNFERVEKPDSVEATQPTKQAAKKSGFATPEQEQERAGLISVIHFYENKYPHINKTADGKREAARKIKAAQKALAKLPPGMLTDAAVLALGDKKVAVSPLVPIWLEGAAIALDGAKSAEEAIHNYRTNGGEFITDEYFHHQFAMNQKAAKAAKPSKADEKKAKAAVKKAERDLHVVASTDADLLALAGALDLDGYISGSNEKLVAQINQIAAEYAGAEADAIKALVQDGKPVLPREFYEAAYKAAKKAWDEQQKINARDPEAYKETLRWGLSAKNIAEDTPAATEYKAGFDHALKGKTRSTLPQGGRHQDGYDDARAWIKTEDGKAWFEGKPRANKEKSTGEALKRVWDRARKDIDSIDATDKKAWEKMLKSTARSDWFPVALADDATPGAKEWVEKFRDKIATFSEYYTRVMVAQHHNARKRWGVKAEQVFTGRFTSYEGLIAERFGKDGSGRAVKVTDEQLLELSKEVARNYQMQLSELAEKFKGLKTLADIQKAIEDTYGQPGEYQLGTAGVDAGLYHDHRGEIEGLFPKKPEAWDAKYSTWARLLAGEDAERYQKDRKDTLMRPRLDRIERNMPDVRNGKSVTAAEFKKAFNFADVTIGEYVTAQEAEDHLNYAYDALHSLALMLGAKPAQLSFGGRLHFSIGALGHGKYAAHFSPSHPKADGTTVQVINVTKTRGDGSVLHEYFHAIDFMTTDPKLKEAIKSVKRLLVQTPKDPNGAVGLLEHFLVGGSKFTRMGRGATRFDHAKYAADHYYRNKGDKTQFYWDAEALDKGSKDPYWSNEYEPWARAAESWGLDRLLGSGQRDDYLQSDWAADGKVTRKTHRGTPYPQGEERKRLNALMDEFVTAIEWTDAGPVLREGHPWRENMPYESRMKAWNDALKDAASRIKEIDEEAQARRAEEQARREAEREQARREALFGKAEEAAEPPTASSEPAADDVPLSEDELSAIFDEEASAARESTQEEPEAEAPGEKLDDMAWTVEDIQFIKNKIELGEMILLSGDKFATDNGLPTIHSFADKAKVEHLGFGTFRATNDSYTVTWTAGGAMEHTPSGKAYTTVSVSDGLFGYPKDEILRKLRVLAGEGKDAAEQIASKVAKKQGKAPASLADEQNKTAQELAGEFAKHGVKGLEKTLDGLVALFGGGPGKLQSFPAGFDEETYKKAKPLFREAAEEFRKAGLSFKEFVRVFFRTLIQQFGDGVKPYAIQFAKEYQNGFEQAEAQAGEEEADAPTTAEEDPAAVLSDWVLARLKASEDVSWQALFEQADKAYGGTQANGKYTPKDAYDAVELAVNRLILDSMPEGTMQVDADGARRQIGHFERLLDQLPTQSKRTAEMDEFQQFSTPPTYAYLANWVASLKYGETYLEPSAGVGGLAVFGKVAKAKVAVNELSARRLSLLRNLPFDRFFGENAEQLNNILPDDVKPTVIVMNPPFSSTAGRMSGKRDTMNGAQHIEQALKRLAPGGRLVAIVGEGMAADKPAFASWWSKIRKEYNVRANVGIDGAGYAKYGTTFDNQILVIDKTGPTTGEVITGKVDSPTDAVALLEAVRNDRAETTQPDSTVAVGTGGQQDAQDGGRGQDAGAAGAAVDPAMGGRGQPATDGQGRADDGRTDGAGAEQAQGGAQDTAQSGKPGNRKSAKSGRSQDADGNRADNARAGERRDSEIKVEQAENAEQGEIGNSVFESYTPKKVRIPGAVPHNTPLVESAAMASVVPPDPSYTPNLPKEVIEKGLLSDAQLESVVYAGQAHQQFLKDGETRRGFFLGDGTGVGKGRQISGVILDNIRQGRTKAVWLSKKKELIEDAKRDLGDLGGDPKMIFSLAKLKPADKIKAESGILFAGYPGIRSMSQAARKAAKAAGGNRKQDDDGITFERIRQIVDWVGKDFDGVIVFDEAHEMGNALPMKGARGAKQTSDQALAGLELQKALPKARIMYVSATGATEVHNLAYAPRLGLWGEGTPFQGAVEFVNAMSKSVSAMELVAQNLKQMGLYLARSLSFDGVTYERLEHQLSPYQRDTYDLLAEAWQNVLNNMEEALKETGVMKERDDGEGTKAAGRESGKIKSAIMSAFWGSHQRFFNQIITAAQMPSILEQIEQDLAAGRSVVLQITNTNEADQERALAKAANKAQESGDEDEGIEELDLTPRDQLITMLEKAFPIQQYEEYTDSEGDKEVKRLRPVFDSEGKPVINKEALARRDELISGIRNIRIPDSPLQMLIDHFGPDKVAEITGRGQRVIKDENGKMKVEKRGAAAVAADSQHFKDGKKRILVFSQAGGTGFSFHSDRRYKNKQQRAHYIVQAGWSADKAVQGFGRSHRTNQANEPVYRLAMTDIPAHKRFISSIARRLEQLGALTAGQRDTAGGSIFSATDNLESTYAVAAVRQFFEQAVSKNATIDGFPSDLLKQMGLTNIIDEKTGGLNETKIPATTQFLNRLLSLRLDTQEVVFNHFLQLLEQQIDMAKRLGKFDDGLQTIKHVGATVTQEKEVFRDPDTNSAVKYIEIDYKTPNPIYPFSRANAVIESKQGKAGWFKNVQSGRVAGVYETGQTITHKDGTIDKSFGVWRTSGNSYEAASKFMGGKFEKITADEAKALWEAENAARPDTRDNKLHMVVGGILPLWDRFNDETVSVARIGVDDGRRFLGRQIFDKDLTDTLNKLNVESSAAKMDGAAILRAVLGGSAVGMSNGWKIKKVRVSNDTRVELDLNGKFLDQKKARAIEAAGGFYERIQWKDRYFIPYENGKVLDELMRVMGMNAVAVQGGTDEDGSDTAFSVAPFYSPLARAIDSAKFEAAPAGQWKLWLAGNAAKLGVKKDEIQWSGLNEWLDLQGKGKVAKADVLAYLDQNGVRVEEVSSYNTTDIAVKLAKFGIWVEPDDMGGVTYSDGEGGTYDFDDLPEQAQAIINKGTQGGFEPKFASYQLPGGENYREVLLTLPTKLKPFDPSKVEIKRKRLSVTQGSVQLFYDGTPLGRTYNDEGGPSDNYRKSDSYWMNSARRLFEQGEQLPDGRRLSEARTGGFQSSHFDQPNILAHIRFNERTDADGKRVLFIEELQADKAQLWRKLKVKIDDGTATDAEKEQFAVIDAMPFNETKAWVGLAMKRMIAYAAENGFDRVAWTTGEQQAERYDLSKQIDAIYSGNNGDGTWAISAKKGDTTVFKNDRLPEKDLPEYVGKDAADRIIASKDGIKLSGLDLKVGGTGMKAFYDQIVPQVANDILKKLGGGKVGQIAFKMSPTVPKEHPEFGYEDRLPRVRMEQPGFDITPAMREQAANGLPLFRATQPVKQAGPAISKPELDKVIKRITARWKRPKGDSAGRIIAVDTPEGLPQEILLNADRQNMPRHAIRGVFHQGHIYLVRANLRNAAEVEETVFHEAYGHYGARLLAGGDVVRMNKAFSALWKRAGELDGVRKLAKEFGVERVLESYIVAVGKSNYPEEAKKRIIMDELLAHIAGKGDFGFRVRVKAYLGALREALRNLARKMGLDGLAARLEKFTDAELLNLLRRQREAVMRGGPGGGGGVPVFSMAENDLSSEYEVPADTARTTVIDRAELAALRRAAAGIESPEKGITFHIADDGRAIVTGPARTKVPARFARFAQENNLTLVVRRAMSGFSSVGDDTAQGRNPQASKFYGTAMPVEYRESGALYFGEIGDDHIDRTGSTRFSRTSILGDSGREYTPEQQAAMGRTGSTVTHRTPKEVVKDLWADAGKKLAQGLVDQFRPVRDLDAKAYSLLRLSKGATGAFEAFMHHGKLAIRDGAYDADTSGGVLEQVFYPLGKESTDFLRWIAGNRADRLAREGKENLFSPEDIDAFKSLADGMTDFDYTLANGKTTRDRTLIYADALAKFNAFNKNVMDMAEESGLIDGESRQFWEREFYVPFYRVADDDGVRGMNIKSGVVRQEAFKQLKGGSQQLNDLLENTLMNWAHLIDASAKNRAARATLEAAAKQGAATPSEAGAKKTVWYRDNGERVYYRIEDPYLMDAISSLEYAGIRGPAMDALSTMKHVLTVGVTASPFFKVRNLIRDSIQAIAVSDLGYNPLGNVKKGFELTDRASQEYVSALAGGGLIRFGTMLEGSEAKRTRQLIKQGAKDETILDNESKVRAFYDKRLEPAIAFYNEMGNRGEEINRMALYDKLIKQGEDHATASLLARDLMDFSMQGTWTGIRFLTQVVPFMNARMQGLYKLGRASQEDKARFATVLGAVTLFSLALLAAYGDDDDWKKREDWDRDNYWWFKLGGIAFRIPKPFEIGAIATLAERSAELIFDKEMTGDRFMAAIAKLTKDQLAINPVPQMVKPVIDLYANHDSFTGRPIESMGMERLDPSYRYNQSTSMVGRGISTAGNALTGENFLSPVQVDHVVRAYFGWLGSFVVGGADMIARGVSNEPTKPAADYWKTATGGMVAELDSARSRYVSQMYDQARELEQAYGTWRNLVKQGKLDEANDYREENADDLKRYRMVEFAKRQSTRINEQIRATERNDDLSATEKRERINVLRDRQHDVAKRLAGA